MSDAGNILKASIKWRRYQGYAKADVDDMMHETLEQ